MSPDLDAIEFAGAAEQARRVNAGEVSPTEVVSACLARIRRPTLLINAINDPFMPAAALPRDAASKSRFIHAHFVREGGHAGFLEGASGRRSWAEGRALAFLERHLLG